MVDRRWTWSRYRRKPLGREEVVHVGGKEEVGAQEWRAEPVLQEFPCTSAFCRAFRAHSQRDRRPTRNVPKALNSLESDPKPTLHPLLSVAIAKRSLRACYWRRDDVYRGENHQNDPRGRIPGQPKNQKRFQFDLLPGTSGEELDTTDLLNRFQ